MQRTSVYDKKEKLVDRGKTIKREGDHCHAMTITMIRYSSSPGSVMSSQFSGLGSDPVVTKAG